ncbi:MAG TPA: hypothetical protein VGM27_07910 [Acidobacteriaceae bacterium]|jgi:DNA-binding beta-propeller fold protein YncE
MHPITTSLILLLTLCPSAVHATDKTAVLLTASTPLPEITGGDFDHFVADIKNNKLYVVTEDYASIEVFDLQSGGHLRSVRGVVKSPRKIALLEDKGLLMVADAGSSACVFLDIRDFHEIARVPLEAGPDAGAYDSKARTFYVGNGGRAAHEAFSYISAINVDMFQVTNRIRVEASTLKTLLLDNKRRKLYVTMRDKNQVGVIDLQKKEVVETWSNPAFHIDSAMAYDPEHRRLFVGDRKPGKLVVLDADNGQVVNTLPIGDTSDDMAYDSARNRIYISSDDGLDVVAQDSHNTYRLLQHADTLGGKVSIYVPSLNRIYVAHTKGPLAPEAGLQIFKVL